jgi:prephenate dehydrogenase
MSAASDGDVHGSRFETVAIIGLGLMGGSLALAMRARWPDTIIVGVDRAEVLEKVQASSAIDRGATDIASAVADGAGAGLDLVVLAAPVLQNIASLDIVGKSGASAGAHRPLIVTDLGSTKRAIVEAARSLPPHVTFLGGHPMAGAARGGFTAARGDLFRGRPWILTPDPSKGAPSAALARLQGFVSELGAEPVVMDPGEHDRVMAYVSHLPQLVASGLMRVIGPHVGADGLAVSGQGLADSTRLASSPAGVWTDICQTNAAPLGKALDALIADLQQVRRQLTEPEAMARWLESGARWRSELPNG